MCLDAASYVLLSYFGIIYILAVTLLTERLESFCSVFLKSIEFCDQIFTVLLNLLPKCRVDPFTSSLCHFLDGQNTGL